MVVATPPAQPPAHGLIGREPLLEQCRARLCAVANPGSVALHGLPGVGKTALAAALASDDAVVQHFADGVLWAGLGLAPNVLGLLAGWAAELGLTAATARLTTPDVMGTVIRSAIGKRRLLLVVDDAWTLEDALAFLVGGPNCGLILTTRFPDIAVRCAGDGSLPVHELSEDDGLALLSRLAPSVVASERDAARMLVRSAGALPLALTLMGRYLQVEAHSGQPRRVQAALDRLRGVEQRLRLAEPWAPAERPPSLPSGTLRSLSAAIEVSDQRLHPAERAALRALAVFPAKPNTFSEEAALAVCAAPATLLDALTDTGLLESAGAGRYTLHQTVADYARMGLVDPSVHTRMANYFVTFVEAHTSDHRTIEPEIPNVLKALDVAYTLGMAESLVRGANAIAPFLQARGLYQTAEIHLERAMAVAADIGDEASRAQTCLHLGLIADLQGDVTKAEEVFERGARIARAIGHRALLAAFLSHQGEVALHRGNYARAEEHLREGIELARLVDDGPAIANLLRLLGEVTDCRGDFVKAAELYEEGAAIARASNDQEALSALLQNLGVKALGRGDETLAEQLYQEGLAHARAIGHRQRVSALLNNLGWLAYHRRQYANAERYFQESLDLARLIGHRLRMSNVLQNLGILERARGRHARAAIYLGESLQVARQVGNPFLIAETLSELGQLHLKQRRLDAASTAFEEALVVSREVGIASLIGMALFGLARVAAGEGNLAQARLLGQEALSHFDSEDREQADEVARWLMTVQEPDLSGSRAKRRSRAAHT